MTFFNYHLTYTINILIPQTVENSVQLVRWNIEKKYLLDIHALGIPVIHTIAVPSEEFNLGLADSIAMDKRWEAYVIKPSVGASSMLCYKFTRVMHSQKIHSGNA